MNARIVLGVSIVATLVAATSLATAADTVEQWAPGAADVDHYVGYDGIGLGRDDGSLYGDMMFGYGVGHSVSAYLGTTLSANGYLTGQSTDPYLGIYFTPLETDNVDLDLFLDFSQGDGALRIAPAFELNLDAAQDLAEFGLYIRVGVPIYGRVDPESPDGPGQTTLHVEPLIGTYKTFGDHQLLVELDMVFRPDASEEEQETELGAIALGWNIGLSETFELINQVTIARLFPPISKVSTHVPEDGAGVSFGVMTGFIATLEPVQSD